MESLTKKLKAMLGTGGTVQGNTIEIQVSVACCSTWSVLCH